MLLERRISVRNVAALYRERGTRVSHMFLVIVIVLDFSPNNKLSQERDRRSHLLTFHSVRDKKQGKSSVFFFFGHLKYPADALSDSIDFLLYMHVFMFKVSSACA